MMMMMMMMMITLPVTSVVNVITHQKMKNDSRTGYNAQVAEFGYMKVAARKMVLLKTMTIFVKTVCRASLKENR